MNKKIIAIGIISIFLLSSLSLTAVGMKTSESNLEIIKDSSLSTNNNPLDLVPSVWYDENDNEMPSPYIEIWEEARHIIIYAFFRDIENREFHESFDIAYFWNDESEPFRISEDCSSEAVFGYWGGVDHFNIPYSELPNKKDFSDIYIRMELDYNNDIAESNNDPEIDAEENNIGISNTIANPKVKSINPLFTNVLARLLDNHPNMFPLLRALLGL